MGPGQLARLAKKRLRYFRYSPPQGGLGGDWDVLEAQLRYTDEGELARILDVLGYRGAPPLEPTTTDLGDLALDGHTVMVHVTRRSPFPGVVTERLLRFTFAVYVTEAHIEDARHLEAWFEAQGLSMSPSADP